MFAVWLYMDKTQIRQKHYTYEKENEAEKESNEWTFKWQLAILAYTAPALSPETPKVLNGKAI